MRSLVVRCCALGGAMLVALPVLVAQRGAVAQTSPGQSVTLVHTSTPQSVRANIQTFAILPGSGARRDGSGWRAFGQLAASYHRVNENVVLLEDLPADVEASTEIVSWIKPDTARCDFVGGDEAGNRISIERTDATNDAVSHSARCGDEAFELLQKHFEHAGTVVESDGPLVGGRATLVETVASSSDAAASAFTREVLLLDAKTFYPIERLGYIGDQIALCERYDRVLLDYTVPGEHDGYPIALGTAPPYGTLPPLSTPGSGSTIVSRVVLQAMSGGIAGNGTYVNGMILPDGSRAHAPDTGGPVWKAFYRMAAQRTPTSMKLHLDATIEGEPHHVDYSLIVDYPLVRCDVRRGELAGTTQFAPNGRAMNLSAVSIGRAAASPILTCADDTPLALAEHFDAATSVVETSGPALDGRPTVIETIDLPGANSTPATRETLTLDAAGAIPIEHTVSVAGAVVRTTTYVAFDLKPNLSSTDAFRGRDAPPTPEPELTVAPSGRDLAALAPGAPLRPMEFPSPAPTQPFAMPGYTPPPFELEPRPDSLTHLELFLKFGPGEPPDIGRDALQTDYPSQGSGMINSRAVDFEIRSPGGSVLARPTPEPNVSSVGGIPPFEVMNFTLPSPIPPAAGRYRLIASWHTHPSYTGYADLEVADIPPIQIGDKYLAPLVGRASYSGPTFDVTGMAGSGDNATVTLGSEDDPTRTHTQKTNCEGGCWPRIVDTPETLALSKRIANAKLRIESADFPCFDDDKAPGAGHLQAGKFLHVTSLGLVAHAMRWIANDPSATYGSYPCGAACSKHLGTWIDSPLLVELSFAPGDVDLVPQRFFGSMRYAQKCVGGRMLLQDVAEFDRVFTVVP